VSALKIRIFLLVVTVLIASTPASAISDCKMKTAAFASAYAAKSVTSLLEAFGTIADDNACDFDIDDYRSRAITALIDAAADSARSADSEAALRFVLDNMEVAGNWRLAEKLGDYYAEIGDRDDALHWYERGIAFVASRPATQADLSDRQTLMKRAAAAKIVGSDDDEGRKPVSLAQSSRDLEGHVAGIYDRELLRGAEVEAVPLPINFVFAEATFTPGGAAAAGELAQALVEQKVESLRLVGHADPRGDPKANRILSLRRAEAVKAFLIEKGVRATIATEGVGAAQPFDVSALAYRPAQEEIWALDRRVEFVRSGR
jgi:outer membrane protein OmpA-like peptidoglycan-associated protein